MLLFGFWVLFWVLVGVELVVGSWAFCLRGVKLVVRVFVAATLVGFVFDFGWAGCVWST